MPHNNHSKKLKKIKIHFILDPSCNSENESSSAMQECYEECVSNKLLVDWIKDPMNPKHNFTKNHVFVFEKFEGDFYEKIVSSTSCLIVGPFCLFTCINKSLPIPQTPTLTMAMDQLIISFSCLSKELKTDLTTKVKQMGGVVNSSLLETTTHLVVGKAYSPKYEKANERNMKVMTPGWINAVFTASQHSGLTYATDHDFAKYKCPVFYNLAFSVSGYGSKKKETFKKLIESHGGTYYGSLQYQVTDILICEKPEGEKFKAARDWGLPCVLGSWLTHSVETGYSSPVNSFLVAGGSVIKCSTPTKDEMPSKFHNSDISISMIQENSHSSHPRTTFPPTPSTAGLTTQPLTPSPYDHVKAVEGIDLLLAKRSEAFLDGCNIYLTGFESAQEEKLRKIIKLGCGVRFTDLDESVTHIVMGAFTPAFHKLYSCLSCKPPVVTVDWLRQCMLSKAPCLETPYLCIAAKPPSGASTVARGPECPSPLSKKGLQMLISPAKPRPSPLKKDRDSPAARKLLQGYLDSQNAQTTTEPLDNVDPISAPVNPVSAPDPDRDTQQDLPTEETVPSTEYFTGLMFLILGFTEDETSEIVSTLREANGKVVANPKTFHGIPDYVIVPFEGYTTSVVPTEDIVTDIWLMECKQQGSVVDVLYYHRPTQVTGCATPLVNCVITISNYVGFERDFLARLSQLLGAGYQEEFMKRDNPKNGKKASTHLVCPTCSGSKYTAAIKWGFPSVNKKWLLECARAGKRLSEEAYLTGCDETLTQNYGKQTSIPNGKLDGREINGVGNVVEKMPSLDTKENQAVSKGSKDDPDRGSQQTQFTQPRTERSKKRKLCLLNNLEPGESNPGSPSKRTALDNSRMVSQDNQLPPPPSSQSQTESQSRGFSQSKPSTRAERKQWEKIMDNLVDDDQMLPPRTSRLSVNTKVEEWVAGNERLAASQTPRDPTLRPSSQQLSQQRSVSGSQPSDLVKTIDELNQQLDRASRDSRGSEDASRPPHPRGIGNSPPKLRPGGHKQPQEESQPRVGWEDYVETLEKHSARNSASSSNSNAGDEKCFVLSNVSEELKVRYSQIVERLGGTLLNTSQCFQPHTTHLVMEAPLRSEKLLCSLASGKWILTTRYLEDCNERNSFLPEQEYEFGNPFSSDKMPRLEGPVVQYAQAAHRWRLKRGGAFTNVRASLFVADKRLDSLRRLIQAGGGHVLDTKDSLKGTHCFWEDGKIDMPIALESFAKAGIYVLPPVYLADYLRLDPPPHPEECLIEPYRDLYERENS